MRMATQTMMAARFMTDGADVVRLARDWIGTPYRHQGAMRGVGCDCLGLIRGLWREIHGAEPETPGAYGRDWAERSGEERLLDAARRHFGPPVAAGMQVGDVLIFRFRADASAKHLGILSGPDRFIHAYEQAGVIESALVASWRRRVAGVFRWRPVLSSWRHEDAHAIPAH